MLNSICLGCRTGDRRIERDTEGYRSGHNGAVLKTVRGKLHAGSNPAPSAMPKALAKASAFGNDVCLRAHEGKYHIVAARSDQHRLGAKRRSIIRRCADIIRFLRWFESICQFLVFYFFRLDNCSIIVQQSFIS